MELKAVALAVLGAMVMCGGLSLYLALKQPPYMADESSQVGYVLVLMDGKLPSLDTLVPADDGDRELQAALGRRWPFSVPTIHTAINPPYPYIASIPTAALTTAFGVRAGPLLGVRLFNVFCTTAAVYVTYRLGRELSGDRRVAAVGSGLFASVLAIAQGGALAYIDGPALLATTGVTWWLARFVRTRSMRDATILGLWCAAASGVRTMSLAYAAAAGAIALLVGLIRVPRSRWVGLTIRLGAPTVVLVGWFLALNQYRYGDPTGVETVYGARAPDSRSTLEVFLSWDSFAAPLDYLLLEVYGVRGWWEISRSRQISVLVVALAVVAAAAALIARRHRQAVNESRSSERADRVLPAGRSIGAWASVVVLSIFPSLMIANHISQGGAPHPRYLFPVIPVLAVAAALVICRAGRWVPAVLVAVVAVMFLYRVPDAGRLNQDVMWPALRGPLVGRPARLGALGVVGAGAVVMVVAHVIIAAAPRRASPGG